MRFLFISLLMVSCTAASTSSNSCAPNFSGNGITMLVTHVGANSYKFQICANTAFRGTIFSVYGAADQNGIDTIDPTLKARASHVKNSTFPGDSFEVSFRDEDLWFAIFEDGSQNGDPVFSLTSEMIRGDLSTVELKP